MPQMRTYIVGSVHHKGAREAVLELRTDEVLTLRRERANKFDSNAVAVYDACGQMLGYIPRQDAPAIAKVLDLKLPAVAKCRIKGTTSVEINWETKQYEQQP
ncbi:HIRAN domain-containing protein [Stenotrophomonas phage DLP4]|nr:HIRAN domain-containing protein [Stenotrophomonas phage DLP4]